MEKELQEAIVQYYLDSASPKPGVVRYLSETQDQENKLIPIYPVKKHEVVPSITMIEQPKVEASAPPLLPPKKRQRIYKQATKRKAKPSKKPTKKQLLTKNF